eukprot:TRINITY_DN1457_c0_g1_i1.p1 TRINITY_DN1457_c0_g1~~TRINITY_DN1457_c0_g1_i1.p1  ORF type:complete len:533 (+),score=106.31 TRINITY_DN1457_c0_g1_i1:64-1662(+)
MAAIPASPPASGSGSVLSIAVLGASGDLSKKKTFPALFNLYKKGMLPKGVKIIGYARSAMTTGDFRELMKKSLEGKGPDSMIDSFLTNCEYTSGSYSDEKAYSKMANMMGENRLFYLALPPSVFVDAAKNIKHVCTSSKGFNRVVVEKPFGTDLQSAKKLGDELGKLIPEKDLYRIDHYLGKDMVQNLLVTRFGNKTFEKVWDKNSIASVQISCKEDIGTEGRGGYFDSSGILRDITQNHLMQIFSLVAMEPPKDLSPEAIRNAKVDVLRQTSTATPEQTVLGQYTAGNGKIGYTDDITVPPNSKAPTFATTVLNVANSRWAGVPFILKAGKALNNKKVDVRLTFKEPENALFGNGKVPPTELVYRVQPDEAIYKKMIGKVPGLTNNVHQTELDLQYNKRYDDLQMPDAYEALLLDALTGKRSNFVRQDELEEGWRIVTPLLKKIDKGELTPYGYPRGTRGPPQSDTLIKAVTNSTPGQYKDAYTWPRSNAKSLAMNNLLENIKMKKPFSVQKQKDAAALAAESTPTHYDTR